ncbi:hypothetical protein GH714_003174 [Hevea brasiliensis]|uniref:Uncharacterized protein n=1 Tax=Hevea brasiliensis TaxID=3981 RepID=A0A6A6MBZ6_HEVBR|nr:hypothetical protein GH714_003174 [Hevea brasiliensis]
MERKGKLKQNYNQRKQGNGNRALRRNADTKGKQVRREYRPKGDRAPMGNPVAEPIRAQNCYDICPGKPKPLLNQTSPFGEFISADGICQARQRVDIVRLLIITDSSTPIIKTMDVDISHDQFRIIVLEEPCNDHFKPPSPPCQNPQSSSSSSSDASTPSALEIKLLA